MKYYKLQELCIDIIDCPHSTPNWKNEGDTSCSQF